MSNSNQEEFLVISVPKEGELAVERTQDRDAAKSYWDRAAADLQAGHLRGVALEKEMPDGEIKPLQCLLGGTDDDQEHTMDQIMARRGQ